MYIYLFAYLFSCIRSWLQQAGSSSPEMEPRTPALGAQSLSHWTTREVPRIFLNEVLVEENNKFLFKTRRLKTATAMGRAQRFSRHLCRQLIGLAHLGLNELLKEAAVFLETGGVITGAFLRRRKAHFLPQQLLFPLLNSSISWGGGQVGKAFRETVNTKYKKTRKKLQKTELIFPLWNFE